MPNHLANESSPYLLQHANNPVDWYPWGPEAIAKARKENKPIFLSVGYSACHWCHVMEHESFEDETIADYLNKHFVSIKVDREERPDIDQIYMNAVQIMTGRGGWPMSVFLTPDLKPFYGGTYWPPTSRMGMPGFDRVLEAIQELWADQRQKALDQAETLTDHLQQLELEAEEDEPLTADQLRAAAADLVRSADHVHGGFGQAPKFPQPLGLQFLLRCLRRFPESNALDVVKLSLDRMARGGMYDHLAGGFARYSVDERWLVPHFEKMLYDNALLADAYLDAFLVTGEQQYGDVVRETLDYVLQYMTDPQGGFYSTEDADSEGEEGKFYLWTPEEVHQVLGDAAAAKFCYVYDVTEAGNFEGKNILNLPKTLEQCAELKGWDLAELKKELSVSRSRLLQVRDQRVRPGRDDKVLVSWNAFMIHSMARAARILDDPRYLEAATRAVEFILAEMQDERGRLLHSWRKGVPRYMAYVDDYTALVNALLTLYEMGFEERWIDEAVRLTDVVLERFRDEESGGFFFTADDHEQLIMRNKDFQDGATPSGNSMAALGMIRLGHLCGRNDYLDAAVQVLRIGMRLVGRYPLAGTQLLNALDMHVGPFAELAILGEAAKPPTSNLLSEVRSRYLPNVVVACRPSAEREGGSTHLDPLFAGKAMGKEAPTVFVCERFVCQAPNVGLAEARETLDRLSEP
jgi:hypothetical protein